MILSITPPVSVAEEIAQAYGQRQVIIFAWDGSTTSATTYGVEVEDSAAASAGANRIKSIWDWPANTIVESARVQALYNRIKYLENEVQELNSLVGIGEED